MQEYAFYRRCDLCKRRRWRHVWMAVGVRFLFDSFQGGAFCHIWACDATCHARHLSQLRQEHQEREQCRHDLLALSYVTQPFDAVH